jgi:serine/threonine protein kinase
MDVLFPPAILLKHSTPEEKKYRLDLTAFLNQHWSTRYSEAVAMEQSNASVVYRVVDKEGKQKILKFVESTAEQASELKALQFWQRNHIPTPRIYEDGTIPIGDLVVSYVEMEYIEGDNVLSLIEQKQIVLDEAHGWQMAKFLLTLNIRYNGAPHAFPLVEYDKGFEIHPMVLLHGDFREGNIIQTPEKRWVLLDPSPKLGHPYSDLAYYVALSIAYQFTAHLKAFLDEYFIDQSANWELLWAVMMAEASLLAQSRTNQGEPEVAQRLTQFMTEITTAQQEKRTSYSWIGQ